jgi:hypothetical protein
MVSRTGTVIGDLENMLISHVFLVKSGKRLCQTSTGQIVWQVVRRDGDQVDGKWMVDV